MAAPAPSAAPGSPQPPARPLPATCAGRGITARFPAACGHTGRALPSLLRGGGRVGPDRTGPAPPPLPAGGGARGRALGKVCLCGWLRGAARPVGAGGRLRALAGQREASGRRSPGGGRRAEPSRVESSRVERVRRPPSASRRERHPPAWGSAGRGRPACSRSSCCCFSVSPGAAGGGRGRAVLGRR